MKYKIGGMVLALSLAISSQCRAAESPFSWLTPITVDARATGTVTILYNEKLTEVLNEKPSMEGIEVIRVLRTRVDAGKPEWYAVDYDEGPSEDPTFSIYRMEADGSLTLVEQFGALELVIPGNGAVYLSGHTNNMFDERRKFTLEGGRFVEVPQPFRYVGITASLRRPIVLHSSMNQEQEVARLPAGTEVTVLLNEGSFYLIKTPFGLVGWFKLTDEAQWGLAESAPIPGLYFAGD